MIYTKDVAGRLVLFDASSVEYATMEDGLLTLNFSRNSVLVAVEESDRILKKLIYYRGEDGAYAGDGE